MDKKLDASYWNSRYLDENIPWDAGSITLPLKNFFDKLENKNLKILVPGCGNAHEAAYLHHQGFTNVFVCDWAEAALDGFIRHCPSFPKENLICADFFQLHDSYDLIIEQTFFCALPPSMRKDYVVQMHRLLKNKGTLAGLLFNTDFPNNPPFGGNETEYRKLFSPFFVFKCIEECKDSIQPRLGNEIFIELIKFD